ncbi:hypothetical protein N9Q25_00680 [bacterium]|nr:hypothetical protein [bacterium]
MATYYKYAERDASSQVNWAEITSNMVNSLNEVQAIRDSKRKAIDDATSELGTTLSEAPQGDHRGLNEFAMTYANNAQQMRLMQDKLLKSGQLKLRDYNVGRANLTQGTQQMFNLSKKYQEQYKTKMERFTGGLSAAQEQWQMAELEGFANFTNHEAYINPTNGQVSIGKLVDRKMDGKTVRTMDKAPGSFTTVDQLNFSVSDQVNKYNLDNFDAEVGKFAKTYLTTDGPYNTLDDVRQMPEFDKMKKDIIESQLVDERAIGSILTDFVGVASNGKAFTFTRDPNKQDANTILLVEDPRQPGSGRLSPDFNGSVGQDQKKSAEKFLDRQLEKQLGSKQTERAVPKPTAAEITRNEKINREDYQVSNVAKLMTGNETQVQTAIDYFRDLNDATKKVIRTPNGIEVTFKNKDGKLETRDISFYVGEGENKKTKTVAQFIESASNLLTGKSESGIKNILKRGNYDKNATFNDKLKGNFIADIVENDVIDKGLDMEVIDKKLNLAVKDLDFYGEDEGEEGLRAKIIEAFPDFEISITPIDNDKFIIDVAGYEGAVTIEGDFMSINNNEGEKEKRKLKAFMRSLYIQKDKKNKSTTNTTNTSTGGNPR